MTGLPVCCRSFATIQFSKPPSPLPLGRARPEIDILVGEEKPTRRVGFGCRPNLSGSYPIAPPRLSSRFRSLTKGLYHLASRFQTPTGGLLWYSTLFAPTQAPRLSAGRCLQVVRILSVTPPEPVAWRPLRCQPGHYSVPLGTVKRTERDLSGRFCMSQRGATSRA